MLRQSNKIDFNGRNIYVGIDVHLKSWKVTIMTEELTHRTFSQPPKPDLLAQYLRNNFPGGTYYSAYEAGFCGYWAHDKLVSLGINSIVVNASDIPTTGKEKEQKNDKRDSQKIARSLRNGDLEPIYIPSKKTLNDRGLVRARATLVKDLSRYKNRIKSFLYYQGIEFPEAFRKHQTHWSNRFMKWLESIEFDDQSRQSSLNILLSQANFLRSSVLETTRSIRELSRTEPYRKMQELLRTIYGISYITAMVILTELVTIDRFPSFDKLCSYIGLIPSSNSSGEKDGTGDLTRRGHILRSVIIESAWTAARIDPALNLSYNEYCSKMNPNEAIIRIARKLLNRIRFVMKNKQPYVCSVVR